MSTTNLLESLAVSCHTGDTGAELFENVLGTPGLNLALTGGTALEQSPAVSAPSTVKTAGPGMASGRMGGGAQSVRTESSIAGVEEFEIFRNDRQALFFFLSRHAVLDMNAPEGPFWFTIIQNDVVAGTEEGCIRFPNINPSILDAMKKRGAVTLIEFENQQPYRVTPCYLSETL